MPLFSPMSALHSHLNKRLQYRCAKVHSHIDTSPAAVSCGKLYSSPLFSNSYMWKVYMSCFPQHLTAKYWLAFGAHYSSGSECRARNYANGLSWLAGTINYLLNGLVHIHIFNHIYTYITIDDVWTQTSHFQTYTHHMYIHTKVRSYWQTVHTGTFSWHHLVGISVNPLLLVRSLNTEINFRQLSHEVYPAELPCVFPMQSARL